MPLGCLLCLIATALNSVTTLKAKPSAFKLPTATVTASVASVDQANSTAQIKLESKSAGVALYVYGAWFLLGVR